LCQQKEQNGRVDIFNPPQGGLAGNLNGLHWQQIYRVEIGRLIAGYATDLEPSAASATTVKTARFVVSSTVVTRAMLASDASIQ
jgi:hypothetical protein